MEQVFLRRRRCSSPRHRPVVGWHRLPYRRAHGRSSPKHSWSWGDSVHQGQCGVGARARARRASHDRRTPRGFRALKCGGMRGIITPLIPPHSLPIPLGAAAPQPWAGAGGPLGGRTRRSHAPAPLMRQETGRLPLGEIAADRLSNDIATRARGGAPHLRLTAPIRSAVFEAEFWPIFRPQSTVRIAGGRGRLIFLSPPRRPALLYTDTRLAG